MTEFTRTSLYGNSKINILTPMMQLPIQHYAASRFMEWYKPEFVSNLDYFVRFNSLSELSK